MFLSALLCGLSHAEIKMPSVFSDNMLLQRDMLVKVWGKADANACIDVAFNGQKKSTKADASGNWSVKLDKMSANKNPQEMTISENGKVGKVIKNILVGEVWIAGGQSNMQWNVARCKDAEKNIAQANNKLIRYFSQNTSNLSKTPEFDCVNGAWTMPSPKVAGKYSAVGYLFAKNLQRDLDVPVGIVFTALGGSKMIAWIPEEKLSEHKYTKSYLEGFKKKIATYSHDDAMKQWKIDFDKWLAERDALKAQNKKIKSQPPHQPNKLTCIRITFTPSMLYNGVVAPLAGYGARGVVWYQGEADSGGLFPTEIATPHGYSLQFFSDQMQMLINSWREKFENPDLSFIQVQLASYQKQAERDWGMARWEQLKTTTKVPNCYLTNIIDCGEKDNIHPKDKQTVADRMVKIALAKVYGQTNINALAPVFKSASYDGDTAKVVLNMFGRKLESKGELTGFEVKVAGKWQKAKAELLGSDIMVKSLNGKKVEGVRYLWEAWARPDACLFNQDGLPVFSFINEK